MIHSPRFIAVLDACVLYPVPIRDLLLNLAKEGLYTPKWTNEINDEWIRNLILNRPDLSVDQLGATVEAMNNAFPDAMVSGYTSLITAIELPDSDDRHVLAAAIRCNADVIVTSNLKDFPHEALREYDIEPQHPDDFIVNIIGLNPEKAVQAFKNQVSKLRKPPMPPAKVLDSLKKVGLVMTAEELAGRVLDLSLTKG